MPNNEQNAEILREIAKIVSHYAESSAKRLEWDESMPEAMREVSRASIASQTAKAAALLAGAEALERLEAMESTSSTMLPKSASGSEEQ
jgi:hypothetical protein